MAGFRAPPTVYSDGKEIWPWSSEISLHNAYNDEAKKKRIYHQDEVFNSIHHRTVNAISKLSHRSMQALCPLDPDPGSLHRNQHNLVTDTTRNPSSLPVMLSSTNTHTSRHSRNRSSTHHARSIHPRPSVPPHSCHRLASFKPNATKHPLCQPPSSGRTTPEMDGRQLISRRPEKCNTSIRSSSERSQGKGVHDLGHESRSKLDINGEAPSLQKLGSTHRIPKHKITHCR